MAGKRPCLISYHAERQYAHNHRKVHHAALTIAIDKRQCVSRGGMMEWQPVTENVALVSAELPSSQVLKHTICVKLCLTNK